jgi:predicted nuclease with RNAse H fold
VYQNSYKHLALYVRTEAGTRRSAGVASDGVFWISKVLRSITQLAKDSKHVTLAPAAHPDGMREIIEKGLRIIEALEHVGVHYYLELIHRS